MDCSAIHLKKHGIAVLIRWIAVLIISRVHHKHIDMLVGLLILININILINIIYIDGCSANYLKKLHRKNIDILLDP